MAAASSGLSGRRQQQPGLSSSQPPPQPPHPAEEVCPSMDPNQSYQPVAKEPAVTPAATTEPVTFKFLPQILLERGELSLPPLEEVTMTLFGAPGTGKTTLAAGRPYSFFVGTEPGQEFLQVAKGSGIPVQVRDWGHFVEIISEAKAAKEAGQLPFKSITLDIVDNLAGYCLDAVCAAKGIAYPPENDFGKTWKLIRTQWEAWMRTLMDTMNVTFLTHCAREKVEVMGKVGTKEVDCFVPTFKGNKQSQYLDGIVHAVGYVHKNDKNRYVVSFENTATCAAKDRTKVLAALGQIDITAPTPEAAWGILSDAYETKAKELGFKIKSRWEK